MCLLIFKPEGVTVPQSDLIHGARANRDGAGIAYYNGRKVVIEKSPKWGETEVSKALAKIGNAPAIIHFRLATHGKVDASNAHPFELPHGFAAAHNGVIHGVDCLPNESDTRAFLRSCVAPFIAPRDKAIDPALASLWGDEIGKGNKLAIMSPTGHVTLVNEDAGTWEDGVWYSNTYFRPSPVAEWRKGWRSKRQRSTASIAPMTSDVVARDLWSSDETAFSMDWKPKAKAVPSFVQWHSAPICSFCDQDIWDAFGVTENGNLVCEHCADGETEF